MLHPLLSLTRRARTFARCRRGGIAIISGVAIPCLALLALGATELMSVTAERTLLQDTADGAALAGASELKVAGAGGVEERAEAYVLNNLAGLAGRSTITVEAVAEASSVKVAVKSNRLSFFGNMLPPGGFNIAVDSTAVLTSGGTPLCVMNLYSGWGANLYLKDTSTLTAPGCAVHSNSSIYVDKFGSLSSDRNQAVRSATGKITPTAIVPVAVMEDPLSNREIPTATCRGDELEAKYEVDTYVPEGIHCGGMVIDKTATVTLGPGVHYFGQGFRGVGDLKVRDAGVLKGQNVVLVFGKDTTLKTQEDATIDLVGRQSGAMSGMVIAATRDNYKWMTLDSTNAKRLEGVIYLPKAALTATGRFEIAQESDWTVTVALGVVLTRGAKLKINKRYSESSVPVPEYVQGGYGEVRLQN
ncbi:MAG: pilus assembly protein TadG-related protein [Pseudomonadota bacterium]|nr:pilus assembly protein TadG-related protein [Pseudomonadota bacterium]